MRKLNILLLILFTIVIIRRVDYVLVPDNNNWKQKIRVIFEEGIMEVDKCQIRQEIIPYGKVRMKVIPRSATTNYYIFKKTKED